MQELSNGSATALNRQAFEYLCDQYKQHNDERCEELANRQRRKDCDGHGKPPHAAPGY